jgi:hypothetical protein
MKTEREYFLAEDDAGCFQLTEKSRRLIAMALRDKASRDANEAKAQLTEHPITSDLFREQARAGLLIADAFDDGIAHIQVQPEPAAG